jgi:F1F0 ATPase subunit 2
MTDALTLLPPSLAGVALGAMFFGGLWWTVRRGTSSRRPALWFVSSHLLRMSLALAGFYAVSGGRWDRLLACLVGFIIARVLVTWLTGLPPGGHQRLANEAGHEP